MDQIKPGDQFEHSRYIIGSPKAGTAKPDVCTVTRVTSLAIYYQTSSGMKTKTTPERLPASVLRWLDTPKE